MSNINGNIAAPVDVMGDIAYVLGRNTGDIGQLCSDRDEFGNRVYATNMWSLYKPIRYNRLIQSSGWEAAATGNYGIAPCSLGTGVSALPRLRAFTFDGLLNGWEYEPPVSYCRVADFNGYDHKAPRPWDGWSGMSTPAYRGGNVWFGLDNVVKDYDDGYNPVTPESICYAHILMPFSDAASYRLGNCYFGVAVFSSSGACVGVTTCRYRMGANPSAEIGIIGQEDICWSAGFDGIGWNAGTYTAIPFFWVTDSGAPMPSGWTGINSGVIYTVPYTSPKTFTVYADSTEIRGVSLVGTCGVDAETDTTLTIGFAPRLRIRRDGAAYTINRVRVEIRGSDYVLVYDTATDAEYTPAVVQGDASGTVEACLVDGLPDGEQQIKGITNCPAQYTVLRGPVTDRYTYTAHVSVTYSRSGGTADAISKDYEIS